jgi:hypothetical protein
MREAFEALDTLVVIDVALTDTAKRALRTSGLVAIREGGGDVLQLRISRELLHLRRGLLPLLRGTLPEAENRSCAAGVSGHVQGACALTSKRCGSPADRG